MLQSPHLHLSDARRNHAADQLLAAAEAADPPILLLAHAIAIGISSVARDVLLIRLADPAAAFSVTLVAGLLGVAPDRIRQAVTELLAARLIGRGYLPILPAEPHRLSAAAR